MTRLQWAWMRSTQRLDHRAMTLIFLAGLALVLHVLGIVPREQWLTALQAEVKQAHTMLDRVHNFPRAKKGNDFPLPPATQLKADLATLHQFAQAQGLTLDKADYQLVREDGFWRYQVRSEGEFSYVATRRFLSAALAQLPHLALDSLSLSRPTADSSKPMVEFSLSFYFSDSPTARAQP